MSVRKDNGAGIFDVSHMGQIKWHGKDAVEFIESLVLSDIRSLGVGEARLSAIINENGGIIDDTVITNAGDYIYQVINGATKFGDMKHFDKQLELFKAKGKDVSYEYVQDKALIAFQGRGTAKILQPMMDNLDLSKLIFMHGVDTKIRGMPCRITRCGYTGEDGFEISVPENNAIDFTKELLKNGGEPCGLGCRDSLRLEAGLCLYGSDMDDTIDPMSAGLWWCFSKNRRETGGFLGYENVLKRSKVWKQKRVGMGFEKTCPIPRHGSNVFNEQGEKIGHITSGAYSPILRKPVTMGYVNKGYHKVDTPVFIEVRNKKYPAKVEKMPFVPTTYYRGN